MATEKELAVAAVLLVGLSVCVVLNEHHFAQPNFAELCFSWQVLRVSEVPVLRGEAAWKEWAAGELFFAAAAMLHLISEDKKAQAENGHMQTSEDEEKQVKKKTATMWLKVQFECSEAEAMEEAVQVAAVFEATSVPVNEQMAVWKPASMAVEQLCCLALKEEGGQTAVSKLKQQQTQSVK